MEIRISDPSLLRELIEFLGRASCSAAHTKGCAIEVELPHAPTAVQARRELGLYLAAWGGLHPGVRIEFAGRFPEHDALVEQLTRDAFDAVDPRPAPL